MSQKASNKRFNLWKGITVRILRLVFLCIITSLVINIAVVIPNAKKALINSTENNMLDLVRSGSKLVDSEVDKLGVDQITPELLNSLLLDVTIAEVESSYAYVVNLDGIFLRHPKAEKVGTEVFNTNINELLSKIPSGNYDKTSIFHYTDENGVVKYASYYVSDLTQWVTVIVADEKDVLLPINTLQNKSVGITLVTSLVLICISLVLSRNIRKPIKLLTETVVKTSNFDFSDSVELEYLQKRNDEIGEMSMATISMQQNLRNIVYKLLEISNQLEDNSVNLKNVSAIINTSSLDNSATSEELAASMEETSATTDTINTYTSSIKDKTVIINKQSKSGVLLADEISSRAKNLYTVTLSSSNSATTMYNEVKIKTEIAIEHSRAVEQVNQLAKTIQDIADQTSLLSLNASIEAARAGDMGKGFAVVAGEIGNLASQTATTVDSIMKIVSDVNNAVKSMDGCMTETLEFLDKKVMADYREFLEVSKQYDADAKEVLSSMDEIYTMSNELEQSASEISTAIGDISITIEDSATGVTDIAERTSDVVKLSTDVLDVVEHTTNSSHSLKEIANIFRL